MKSSVPNCWLGTIIEVLDPDTYQVKVDIPGYIQGALALPFRGEVDEPKPGNLVFLRSLDPIFQSAFLYSKLKENDFIGFRARGKMVDITEDHITIGIFSDSDYPDSERPEPTTWIKVDSEGNVEINAATSVKVVSPKVSVTGGELETTNGGTCAPSGMGGFCGIPVCPFTGAPHIGNKITGT